MIFDYETLKVVWWLLIGVLLIGFVITDGFDMGAAALLPFLGNSDDERRAIIDAVGPQWDGNQVWIIMAGGATVAAWPAVYGAISWGFYIALLLVLFAVFSQPFAFDYRRRLGEPRVRRRWDWVLFAGGAFPALMFGLVFGNLLHGVPFHYDDFLRPRYTGSFSELLNPFALLCGVVSLSMLVMHGAVWLQMRAEEPIEFRAATAARVAALVLIVAFAIAGLWVAYGIDGYRVVSIKDIPGAPDPTAKTVVAATGAWLDNYGRYPWMVLAPVAGFVGAGLTLLLSALRRPGLAFLASALAIIGVVLTAGFSMFPFIMPSSTQPGSGLTIWDAASSQLTLTIMLWAAVIFVPIMLIYTLWTYRAIWGKVAPPPVQDNSGSGG